MAASAPTMPYTRQRSIMLQPFGQGLSRTHRTGTHDQAGTPRTSSTGGRTLRTEVGTSASRPPERQGAREERPGRRWRGLIADDGEWSASLAWTSQRGNGRAEDAAHRQRRCDANASRSASSGPSASPRTMGASTPSRDPADGLATIRETPIGDSAQPRLCSLGSRLIVAALVEQFVQHTAEACSRERLTSLKPSGLSVLRGVVDTTDETAVRSAATPTLSLNPITGSGTTVGLEDHGTNASR